MMWGIRITRTSLRVIVVILLLSTVMMILSAQNGDNAEAEIDYRSILEDMSAEEVTILTQINQTRLRAGLTPLAPNALLNDVAEEHLGVLQSRGNNLGDVHIREDGSTVDDWLVGVGYPTYDAQRNLQYRPDVIAIPTRPDSGLGPENIIRYWVDNEDDIISYLMLQLGAEIPFYSNRYREVGIAYRQSRGSQRSYFVMIFASQPNALPVIIAQSAETDNNDDLYLVRDAVTRRDVVLFISNELAFPEGDGDSIGRVTLLRVSERLEQISCPPGTGIPEGWSNYNAEVDYTLSTGLGTKTIFVYMCDDFGTQVITEVPVIFTDDPNRTIYRQWTPVPVVSDGTIEDQGTVQEAEQQPATNTIAPTATPTENIAATETAQAILATQNALTITETAIAGVQTALAIQQQATDMAAVTPTENIAATETAGAIIATQESLHATSTAIVMAQTSVAVQQVTNTPTSTLTSTPPTLMPTIEPSPTVEPTPTSTLTSTATLTPTLTSTTQETTSVATAEPGLPDMSVRWNSNYLAVVNDSERRLDLSRIAFGGANGQNLQIARWSQFASVDVSMIAPGRCLLAYVLVNEDEITAEDVIDTLELEGCTETAPMIAVSVQDGYFWQENFAVLRDSAMIQSCTPQLNRLVHRCDVALDASPIGSTPTPTPARDMESSLQLNWTVDTPLWMVIRNSGERTLDLTTLRIVGNRSGEITGQVLGDIVGDDNLRDFDPGDCLILYSVLEEEVPEHGIPCSENPLTVSIGGNLIWAVNNSFDITVVGQTNTCTIGTQCRVTLSDE